MRTPPDLHGKEDWARDESDGASTATMESPVNNKLGSLLTPYLSLNICDII